MLRPTFARRLVAALALAGGSASSLASAGAASFYDVTLSWQDFTFASPVSPVETSTANSATLVDGLYGFGFSGHFSGPNGYIRIDARFKFNIYLDACTPTRQDAVFFRAGYYISANVGEFFFPMGIGCADAGPLSLSADFPFSVDWSGPLGQSFDGGLIADLRGVPIPEPSTYALLLGGLAALALASRKRLQDKAAGKNEEVGKP